MCVPLCCVFFSGSVHSVIPDHSGITFLEIEMCFDLDLIRLISPGIAASVLHLLLIIAIYTGEMR